MDDIKKWLGKMKIGNYTIRDNGVVDVNGDVDLEGRLGKLERLPVQFGHVTGSFSCGDNKLTSLRGGPSVVDSNFDCSGNRLTTLDGSPISIGGSFHCNSNKLTSLINGPTNVVGAYSCGWNKITSLDGSPRVVKGEFNCAGNYLTNLKGGPDSATDYDCYHCNLKSLEGAPREVSGAFLCYWNALTSLVGGPQKVGGRFVCWGNKFKDLIGAPEHVGGEFNCDRIGKAPKLTSLEGAPKVCGKFSYGGLGDLNDFQGKDVPEYMKDYLPSEFWDTHIHILQLKNKQFEQVEEAVIPDIELRKLYGSLFSLSFAAKEWCLYVEDRGPDRSIEKKYFYGDILALWGIFQKAVELYKTGKILSKVDQTSHVTYEEYTSQTPAKGNIRLVAMAIVKSRGFIDDGVTGFTYCRFWEANGIRKERWNRHCEPLCTLVFKSRKLLETTGVAEAAGKVECALKSAAIRESTPNTHEEIEIWLKECGIWHYSISETGVVDVDWHVHLEYLLGNLPKLPVQFGNVNGRFVCHNNNLTTLVGCPKRVSDIDCSNNLLTSLEGAPNEVKGDFNCRSNRLISLKGCPSVVGGSFDCYYNSLASLEGAPRTIGRDFDCATNRLVSLIGAPVMVKGSFDCRLNQLRSLEGAPEHVGSFISDNLDKFLGADIPEHVKEYVSKEWWDTHLVAIESKKTLNQPIAENYEIELFD